MALGETHIFEYLHNSYDSFTVEQIDTLYFGGEPVARYRLVSQIAFETYIYDRFGPEHGFFEQWLASPWDGNDYYLRCYYDDKLGLAKMGAETCISIVSPVTENGPASDVNIYPNPAGNFLYLDFQTQPGRAAFIILTNSLGEMMAEQTLDESPAMINVAHLPPGFYTGILRLGQQQVSLKFVKR